MSDQTKNVKKSNGSKNDIWKAWAVPSVAMLLLLFLNLFYHDQWLDSDMAAEMVFSRFLAQEGEYFATGGWYYSTEFRVLYTQLIMQPLFLLFHNWHVIRVITNMLTYSLLLGSYFYMIWPLNVRFKTSVRLSALLLLPFSETMITHVQMGNTYMFHMILVFFLFGLFLRISERYFEVRIRKLTLFGCYLLMSMVFGLSGVRYLLAVQVPLILASVVYLLKSHEFALYRREMKKEHLKKLFSGVKVKYLIFSIAGAFSAVLGYGINVFVFTEKFAYQTYEATNFISVYQGILGNRIQDTLGSLLMLFGYIPDKGFLSLRGMITMIAFVLIGTIVFIVVRSKKIFRNEEEKNIVDSHRRFLLYFFLSAFLLNTFVFIFTTSTIVPRYYITVMMFAVPLLAVYYEKERLPLDKKLLTLILCTCMLLATAKTVLSFISTDKNGEKREAAAFLAAEGYSFGYATYWNANIVTELTNGQVEIANINKLEDMDFFLWSSPKKYYEEGYHEGKTFLLLSSEEADRYQHAAAIAEGDVVYEDAWYQVLHYDSVEDFLAIGGLDERNENER